MSNVTWAESREGWRGSKVYYSGSPKPSVEITHLAWSNLPVCREVDMWLVTVNVVTQTFLVCHIRPASFSTGPLASESGRHVLAGQTEFCSLLSCPFPWMGNNRASQRALLPVLPSRSVQRGGRQLREWGMLSRQEVQSRAMTTKKGSVQVLPLEDSCTGIPVGKSPAMLSHVCYFFTSLQIWAP